MRVLKIGIVSLLLVGTIVLFIATACIWQHWVLRGVFSLFVYNHDENASQYNIKSVEIRKDSPLQGQGKTIIFLGSSVTYSHSVYINFNRM